MASIQHRTRGRRFSVISVGDISKWAKGATRFAYPEPKNAKLKPVDTKVASEADNPVKAKEMAKETISPVVMVAPKEKEVTVGAEAEKAGRAADAVLKAVDTSNRMNMVYESLIHRPFFTK